MRNGIDQRLAEGLSCLELAPSHLESCRRLRRLLQKSVRRLRRYRQTLAACNKLSPAQRWIAENFHQIEREGESLLRRLRKVRLPSDGKGGLPVSLYFLKTAAAFPGFRFTDESVRELIFLFERQRAMTNAEHDYFPSLMKASALLLLEESVRNDAADKHREQIERCVQILFEVDKLDSERLNRETNRLEQVLREDPAGVYALQDSRTRALYRWRLAHAADLAGTEELAAARAVIAQAKRRGCHVGFPLMEYYGRMEKRNPLSPYLFQVECVNACVLALLLAAAFQNPFWALLFVLPLFELFRPFWERLAQKGSGSSYAPRLDWKGTVPEKYRTLVAVSTLLPEEKELSSLQRKLEDAYLTNRQGAVGFCLLCDLAASSERHGKGDRARIAAAKRMIRGLNRRWGKRFVLLVRDRSFSKTQREYTGAERKRGAITELIELRFGKPPVEETLYGAVELIRASRYLLALDYDTGLTIGAVAELASIAAHPLHRPILDTEKGVVKTGYGIIAPRMALDLKTSLRTAFSRLMAGVGGTSAYDASCGELYQDLYGEGIFSGKGLIDMEAYHALLPRLFAEETVLSHDILEGSILRTLFAGDVELTDGFPSDETGFFSRLHRWIRGDFQNVPFLFKRVRLYHGIGENPLNRLSRWKLFDNLRRALVPAASLTCLLAAFPLTGTHKAVLLLLGVLSPCAPLLYSLWRMLAGGSLACLTTRFYSGILPKSAELFLRAAFSFALLPQLAWVSLDAAIRGLWRRCVSRREMLAWTASNRPTGKKAAAKFLFYVPQWIVGTACVCGDPALRLCGVLFLLAIPAALCFSRPSVEEAPRFTPEIRARLLSDVRRMLAYYGDFAGKEDHFLPPDNVQQLPVFVVAHRTSPTNIGLLLLSWLTAADLRQLSAEELESRCERLLATVEGLEKFHGNLYNWYDTETLAVLPPGFVSAVDSGNFVCFLTAFREGIREYERECPALSSLGERADRLIRETDLSVFYDKRRKLFSVGWNAAENKLSPSHYDMLMSEARMLSYYAVAKGQVPPDHWTSLSRVLSRRGAHVGPMSWTGTLFEYYMPELLLHCARGSIGYEALGYCLACQKARVRHGLPGIAGAGKIPWGISESGIFCFDAALNYQYTPNGVQRLALKRGMDRELVVSPYSSYLALSRDPEGAVRNLILLEHLGAYGKYGYYEALDYTRERVGDSPFEIVRSQMAHHLGMSIVAVGNALNENRMQKRFLRDPELRAARGLLCEKIPVGEIILSDYLKRKLPELPPRKPEIFEPVGMLDPRQPRVKLLSNAGLSCVLTDVGASWLRTGRTDLTRRTDDLLGNPLGSFCFAYTGEERFSLTFAPGYCPGVEYETSFSQTAVLYTAKTDTLSARTEVRLHRSQPCEQRAVTLQNLGNIPRELTLLFYLEPSLFPREDDEAHKAFSKLFLEVEEQDGAVAVSRKKRGGEAIFWLAAGFREQAAYELIASREDIFERPDVSLPRPEAFTGTFENRGGLPDPCAALRVRLALEPGGSRTLTLLTTVGGSRADALACLHSMRRDAPVDGASSAGSRFQEGSLEHRIAQTLLPKLLFSGRGSSLSLPAVSKNRLGTDALWRLGISGDFPLVSCPVSSPEDWKRIAACTICHSLLRLAFLEYDLLFLFEGNGEAAQKLRREVEQHCPPGAIGSRAGIHLVDTVGLGEDEAALITALSRHTAGRNPGRLQSPSCPYLPQTVLPAEGLRLPEGADLLVEGGAFLGESFFVGRPEYGQGSAPRLPWCHILANPTFGTLLSDRALGFTWAVNSRQNKLTPWYNDPLRDNRGERMLLRLEGDCYDLVNGARAEFCPRYARYEGYAGEVDSCVTVRVPAKGMIKYLEVSLTNRSERELSAAVCYYTEPCLNVSRENSRMIKGEIRQGALLLHNPMNRSVPAYMALWAEGEPFTPSCERAGFLCGDWAQNTLPPAWDLCAALTVQKKLLPGGRLSLRFAMAFGASGRGALSLLKRHPDEPFQMTNRLLVHSADASMDALVNTWLPWQALASRVWGRTGFYQCGGAYGFRDQLQDAISLLPLMPSLARIQLLRCCAVQFEAGDVMHWWHPLHKGSGGKRGVRTRYSDDPVWLAWAIGEYVERTGDESLLTVPVPYLLADELPPGQKDSYLEAVPTAFRETVWEHCKRALARAGSLGRHGLPKMGGGDWNDGYNQVGFDGEGESVWLGQFLSIAFRKAAALAKLRKEPATAREYGTEAARLLEAVDRAGWDGEYYLRAFYDDGRPMGSRKNQVCRIDSLPQSFSVLADMPDKTRRDMAMKTAIRELVDRKKGIIRLFTPAFSGGAGEWQRPGYVQSYPPGIRENGGQYTHAAVWLAMAAGENGMPEEFFTLVRLLNPAKRCQKPGSNQEYALEPYWMAADIYTNPAVRGRGGWSMYTGSAGWYYRLLTETLLGFHLHGGKPELSPLLPEWLEGAELVFTEGEGEQRRFLLKTDTRRIGGSPEKSG